MLPEMVQNSRAHPKQGRTAVELGAKLKKIKINRVVTEIFERTVVRGSVDVPANLPPIEKALSTSHSVNICSVETNDGQVLVEGVINIQINYQAYGKNTKEKFFAGIPYCDFIEAPNATKAMTSVVKAEVKDILLFIDDKQGRNVTLNIVLNNQVIVNKVEEITVLTDVPSGCHSDKEAVIFNEITDIAVGKLDVAEEILIPAIKPAAKQIVSYRVLPLMQNYIHDVGTVTVNGWLQLEINYLDQGGENRRLQRFIAYSIEPPVPGARPGLVSEVHFLNQYTEVKINNQSGSSFMLNFKADLLIKVFQPHEEQVITQISNCRYKFDFMDLTFESLAEEVSGKGVILDTAALPTEMTDGKINEVRPGPVEVTTINVIGNRLLIKGYGDFLIYLGTSEGGLKYIYRRALFKTVLRLMKPTDCFRTATYLHVDQVKTDIVDGRLKLLADIDIKVQLFKVNKCTLAAGINSVSQATDKQKSTIFFNYTLQPDDTLEKLAQRFGTTVEAILALNHNLRRGDISAHKKIKIPCEVKA